MARVFEGVLIPASGGFGMWEMGEYVATECETIADWLSLCEYNGLTVETTDALDGRVYEQNGATIYAATTIIDGEPVTTYHAVSVHE